MKRLPGTLILFALALVGMTAMAQNDSSYRSEDGLLTVRSAGTGYTPSGPAPEFAAIDSTGDGAIDNSEAPGYKLLANDFKMADSNHDGRVSRREYERWAAMP
jgi:hypothetical protein